MVTCPLLVSCTVLLLLVRVIPDRLDGQTWATADPDAADAHCGISLSAVTIRAVRGIRGLFQRLQQHDLKHHGADVPIQIRQETLAAFGAQDRVPWRAK